MAITNNDNIKKWSEFSKGDIEKFGDEGDKSREYLLNPSIFELLGEITGKKVLDAGCGTGYLSRKLAKLGALVTGVEPSESLYAYCVERESSEKLGITYIKEDLSSLYDLGDQFDVVIANMVLMDIPQYEHAIKNCMNALTRNGIFVYSLLHPCFPGFDNDWERLKRVEIDNYFEERAVEGRYGSMFYRPLQTYINCVNDYRGVTERIIEPQLSKENSEGFSERNLYVPQFIIVRARKL
jgi:SAM-dependent methyltransferase